MVDADIDAVWDSTIAPMLRARSGMNGVMARGCFHVWGGEGPGGMFPDHDYYDPRTNQWIRLRDMPLPVHGVYGSAYLDGLIWAPGGGTTDYAVHIFHEALRNGSYTSFLAPGTTLPMMYMPDAIRATIELMEAPAQNIKTRTSYNLAAISFSPEECVEGIKPT